MDHMSQNEDFDPNQYYRIINVALGPERSLDVTNPPDGSLFFGPTGPYSGQLWQFLSADDAHSNFYLTSFFLGAKMKLDVVRSAQGYFLPHLRDYVGQYNQTWTLSPHVDAFGDNRTTWTIVSDLMGTGEVGPEGALSVYNDTYALPWLAQVDTDDTHQRWYMLQVGMPVDDPTYSATHLPALATEAPVCCPSRS